MHSILSFTHEEYGRATSLSNIKAQLPWSGPPALEEVPDKYYMAPEHNVTQPRRANATILMLARNSDTDSAVRSVRELEDKFNRKYKYPWVFLNEEPFSDDFKKCVAIFFLGRSSID